MESSSISISSLAQLLLPPHRCFRLRTAPLQKGRRASLLAPLALAVAGGGVAPSQVYATTCVSMTLTDLAMIRARAEPYSR